MEVVRKWGALFDVVALSRSLGDSFAAREVSNTSSVFSSLLAFGVCLAFHSTTDGTYPLPLKMDCEETEFTVTIEEEEMEDVHE